MQKYSKINAADYVKDSLLALNDTHETLLSQNSGAAFPTANLVVGMTCFRTDQNKTYTLKSISPLSWVLTDDLGRDIYDAETLGGKKPADFAHATSDGNMHVPATGTNSKGKVLTAGGTAGSMAWENPPAHVTGDGNLHVPATGTISKGKVLKAGTTAGSFSWEDLTVADIKDLLSTISGLPVGAIIPFPAATIPPGYLKCNGAAVGRATYPELFACIGTTYGAGNGSTTFNLPDLRGIFVKGLAEGRSIEGEVIDTGRTLGSYQGDAIRNITGEVGYSGNYGLIDTSSIVSGAFTHGSSGNNNRPTAQATSSSAIKLKFDASVAGIPIADENRPRNVAMIYCIKAFDVPVNQSTVDMSKLAQDIAGLSADKVDFTDFTQSLTGNGWVKLPNDLIFQWASGIQISIAAGQGYDQVIPFPIAFPNMCLIAFGMGKHVSGSRSIAALSSTTSNTSVTTQLTGAGSQTGVAIPMTFAIGY